MPIEGAVLDRYMSYVDRRDTLNRLERVAVTGPTAVGWLAELDPSLVRMISDCDLAAIVGGVCRGTGHIDDPCAYGYGPYGSGPFGGPCAIHTHYPEAWLFPSPALFPEAA